MNSLESETAIVFLGLAALAGLSSLAALLWGRRLTATPRPRPAEATVSAAAAGPVPAAAEAPPADVKPSLRTSEPGRGM